MNNITVYAENSFELQDSNEKLSLWCIEKIKFHEDEAQEIADVIVTAKKCGAQTSKMRTRLSKAQRTIKYYQKIKKAIDLGYALIPSAFWSEVIAVRVKKDSEPDRTDVQHDNLPAGEGKYVNAESNYTTRRIPNDKGNKITHYIPTSHKDTIEFKGKDKGVVLNATNTGLLINAYGTESGGWIGKEIGLTVTKPFI